MRIAYIMECSYSYCVVGVWGAELHLLGAGCQGDSAKCALAPFRDSVVCGVIKIELSH